LEELWTVIFSIFRVASIGFYSLFFVVWIFYIIGAFLIGIIQFIFWIIALVDCIRRNQKDFPIGGENAKLVWMLLLIFTRGVAGVIYYLIIMRNTSAKK